MKLYRTLLFIKDPDYIKLYKDKTKRLKEEHIISNIKGQGKCNFLSEI